MSDDIKAALGAAHMMSIEQIAADRLRLINELAHLRALLSRVKEDFEIYALHQSVCIRSYFEGGEATDGGGYRCKFKGKWYQSRPVDETPKCDCGLDGALAYLAGIV
jgi:hypothetical protein